MGVRPGPYGTTMLYTTNLEPIHDATRRYARPKREKISGRDSGPVQPLLAPGWAWDVLPALHRGGFRKSRLRCVHHGNTIIGKCGIGVGRALPIGQDRQNLHHSRFAAPETLDAARHTRLARPRKACSLALHWESNARRLWSW